MKKVTANPLIAASVALILHAGSAAAVEQTLTRSTGAPVGDNQNSLTAGPMGPSTVDRSNALPFEGEDTQGPWGGGEIGVLGGRTKISSPRRRADPQGPGGQMGATRLRAGRNGPRSPPRGPLSTPGCVPESRAGSILARQRVT